MKVFEKIGKKPLFLGISVLLMAPLGATAQEYDDLYFNSKDRKEKETVVTAKLDENSESNKVLSAYENDTYDGSTYSVRNINPEYLAKYNNGLETEEVEESDEYFPENYSSEREYSDIDRYYDNAPVVNNYYNGFPDFCTYNPYRPRVSVGIGYGSGWYGSGFSYSVRYGSPGFYDPFYSPFYGGGFYGARYYDPFYARYAYPYYGTSIAYYSGYNRGFNNGYYYRGGEVVRMKNGREVVRGARTSRTSYRGNSYGTTAGDTRVRDSGRIERGDYSITRGRTRVNSTDISESQNELGRSRTTQTTSTRSRNAVTGSGSRNTGSIDRSTYSSRSRNARSSTYSRQRVNTGSSSRSRTSTSSSSSGYQRNYKSNSSGSSYGSRSRSYSSPSRSYGSSSGSRTRSSGFGSSSGGSRSRSSGFSSGGSRSRSSSGGGSSRSRSRSNN